MPHTPSEDPLTTVDLNEPIIPKAKRPQPEKRGLQGATIVLDPNDENLPQPSRAPSAQEAHRLTPADKEIRSEENAPRLSKEELRASLIFERTENRWTEAKKYDLPHIGDTIGNYKILSELGRGGFGAVYRAKNLTLGREEALKLILPSAKTECSDIEKRFEREINIVSRLEHPNIVTLYSSGMLNHGILWMTTELIQGDRLDSRLQREGAQSFEKANQIMIQLMRGLMEAHQRHIVHRDLKPANIMLQNKAGYKDQVIILDFGLSKAIGPEDNNALQNLTNYNSKRVYGTPQYMAPEQLKMAEIGPWTDVYAAGLIYFELLTGESAVQGTTLFDVAYKQHYIPVEFPVTFTNAAAKQIIQKACQKQPSQRYQSASEFYEALEEICDDTASESGLKKSFYTSKTLILDKSQTNLHPPKEASAPPAISSETPQSEQTKDDDIYTCETEMLDKSETDVSHLPPSRKGSNTEKISVSSNPFILDDHTIRLFTDQINKQLNLSPHKQGISALQIIQLILTIMSILLLGFILVKDNLIH